MAVLDRHQRVGGLGSFDQSAGGSPQPVLRARSTFEAVPQREEGELIRSSHLFDGQAFRLLQTHQSCEIAAAVVAAGVPSRSSSGLAGTPTLRGSGAQTRGPV